MRAEALEVLDTEARIPYVRRRGDYLYNFWRDAANPRGLWRRTTLDSYRTTEPDWDVIFDVDALADAEDENWVWAGAEVLEPDHSLALIELSRGGADATVVREFDMEKRQFVAGGFELPEAKSGIAWQDRDTVLVGTEFGPDSMTDSGYPRIVKRWRRGQPLRRRPDAVRGRGFRCQRRRRLRSDAGLRAALHHKVVRLLQPRPLRASWRRVDRHRHTHRRRRCRCTASGC